MKRILRRLAAPGLFLALFALAGCDDGIAECPTESAICGGVCTPIQSDSNNCGGCGLACSNGFECVEGACVAPECLGGTELCDAGCVDTQTDRDNCGACGEACDVGDACVAGACEPIACETGLELCGNDCIDIDASAAHCGACGNACEAGDACVEGACVPDACEGEDCLGGATEILVACFHEGVVTSFDPETHVQADKKATGIDGPQSIAILDEDHLIVAGSMDATLYVFDRTTMAQVATATLGAVPNLVELQGDLAYVINSGVNTVQVLSLADPTAPKTVDEVSTGPTTNPMAAAFDDEGQLWVSLWLTGELLPIDFSGAKGVKGEAVALPAVEGNAYPTGVAVVGDMVFTTLNNLGDDWSPAGNGRLVAVDRLDRSATLIDLGATCLNPGFIAKRGADLFVACTGVYGEDDGEVVRVDATEQEVAERFTTGGAPSRLAVDRASGTLYVADTATGGFIVIDTAGEMSRITACAPGAFEYAADILLAY